MLGDIAVTEFKPLVIFGAGASYDLISKEDDASFLESEYKPPLTDGIFETRPVFKVIQLRCTGIQGLIGTIRHSILSFEEALEKIQNDPMEAEKFAQELPILKQYLGYLFGAVSKHNIQFSGSNYHTFFRSLNKISKEFCVVNFNYDFLAQKAMTETVSRSFTDIDLYARGPIKLIHPHGSVMWSKYADGNIKVSTDYNYSNSGDFLTIPTVSGKKFTCPDDHIQALKNFVTNDVNVVIIIGWKGKETHFKKEILEKMRIPKKIIIVGGEKTGGENVLRGCGLDRFIGVSRLYISEFSKFLMEYPDFTADSKTEHYF